MTLHDKLRRLIAKWRDDSAFENAGGYLERCAADLEVELMKHDQEMDQILGEPTTPGLQVHGEVANPIRESYRATYLEGYVAGSKSAHIASEEVLREAEQLWHLSGACEALNERFTSSPDLAEDRAEWDAAPRW